MGTTKNDIMILERPMFKALDIGNKKFKEELLVKTHFFKKISVILLTAVLLITTSVNSVFASLDDEQAVFGNWRFNEGASPTQLTDSSSNARHGTLNSIVSGDWVQGRSKYFTSDKAINFAGSSSKYISFPNIGSNSYSDITISCWINLNNWINQTNAKGIMGAATNNGNPHLMIRDNGKLRFDIKGNRELHLAAILNSRKP